MSFFYLLIGICSGFVVHILYEKRFSKKNDGTLLVRFLEEENKMQIAVDINDPKTLFTRKNLWFKVSRIDEE